MQRLLLIFCLAICGCAGCRPAFPPAPPSLYSAAGNISLRADVVAYLGNEGSETHDWYLVRPLHTYRNWSSATLGEEIKVARPSHQERMPLDELTLVINYENGIYTLVGWVGPKGPVR